MAGDEDQEHDRLFTLSEANHLIPQLQSRLASVRQAKAVLARTKDDIRRASARAEYGGGSTVGPLYLSSLHQISSNVQAIQEMGVLVKDLDLGLCGFPHLREGRVVFLCWKLGETQITGVFRERVSLSPGATIRVRPDINTAHLFAADDGQRLN